MELFNIIVLKMNHISKLFFLINLLGLSGTSGHNAYKNNICEHIAFTAAVIACFPALTSHVQEFRTSNLFFYVNIIIYSRVVLTGQCIVVFISG